MPKDTDKKLNCEGCEAIFYSARSLGRQVQKEPTHNVKRNYPIASNIAVSDFLKLPSGQPKYKN